MEQETYEVENRWRNKYMNLGRELGEIINSQQDRILSLAQENTKLKRELWHLKKSKGRNGSKINFKACVLLGGINRLEYH